jgi:hypothetical protein
VTITLPVANQRQVMQRLRTEEWRSLAKLNVAAGDGLLNTLLANGWIERRIEGRTLELKLTFEGFEALTAKIPARRQAGLKAKSK